MGTGLARPLSRAVIAVLLSVGLTAGSAPAPKSESTAVLAANAQFYVALNRLFEGDTTPMVAVWSHADDVTYMGPAGGFERGWSTVLKDWEGQAALTLGGRVEPADVQLNVGRDLAVVNLYEQGENTNAKGKVERVKLRATSMFRKEGGQWKMIGHHTDTLPYLAP